MFIDKDKDPIKNIKKIKPDYFIKGFEYKNSENDLTNNIQQNTFSKGLRLFLEKATILTLNLVTRKNLWKKLLSENLENMDDIDL